MTRILAPVLLAGLFTLVACREQSPPPPTPPQPTVTAPSSEPDAETPVTLKDVTGTAGAYASQQWDKLAASSKEQLAAMEAQFAELQAAAKTKGADAEAKVAELKESFDEHLATAETKLEAFKESAAPRVEQAKEELSKAVNEVSAILKDAWSRVGAGETPAVESTPATP